MLLPLQLSRQTLAGRLSTPSRCALDKSPRQYGVLAARLFSIAVLSLAASLISAPAADAATLAYWRFEGDGVTVPVAGNTQVEDTNGRTTTATRTGIRVKDVSGNGNDLWAWDHPWAGYTYQNAVAAASVPQTGATNHFSVRNAGSFPAMLTWSKFSAPTRDLETITPINWTIEASINMATGGGTQTFIGRDGASVTGARELAPLYFQVANNTLRLIFVDMAGTTYQVSDTSGALATNTWYHVAAVSDGATVRLYRNSGSGYKLVGATPLTSTDRRLAYDRAGSSSGGDTQWGWSLGRGRYGAARGQGDAHADRFNGYIDEVRISDTALRTDKLLFASPASPDTTQRPGAFTLAILPDTQNSSRYDQRIFQSQTQWIADNAKRLGIPFTMHLGDIVDQHWIDAQWQGASTSMATLENAGLPYSILPGNHDLNNSGTWDNGRTASQEKFLAYFSPQRALRNTTTFGGRDPRGFSEYHVFEAQGQRFLVLSFGWNASSQTLDWAKNVMRAIPLPTIITNHQLLDIKTDEVSPLWTEYGEYLWTNLVKDNNQIFMMINGHHHGASRDIRMNAAGKPVLGMVLDYQADYQGGNGYMRLLQLDMAAGKVNSIDFSPWVMSKIARGEALTHLDKVKRDAAQETFSIDYDLAGRIQGITGQRPGFAAAQDGQIDALEVVRAELDALPQAPTLEYAQARNDLDFPINKQTVAHWRFDGYAAGDAVPVGMPLSLDISGNGNDLMRVDFGTPDDNALVFSADAPAGSSSLGSVCLSGGGRLGLPGAYLTTFEGMPLGLESFRNGYTIEAFFKLSPEYDAQFNRWSGIVSRAETGAEVGRGGGDAGESAAGLNISNIREIQWAHFPSSRSDIQTAWSFSIGRDVWHHVAAVNDGRQTTLYVDGISDFRNPGATDAAGLAASMVGTGWLIGASHYEHQPYIFNGCLGEIRISRRALAPSEFLTQRINKR